MNHKLKLTICGLEYLVVCQGTKEDVKQEQKRIKNLHHNFIAIYRKMQIREKNGTYYLCIIPIESQIPLETRLKEVY